MKDEQWRRSVNQPDGVFVYWVVGVMFKQHYGRIINIASVVERWATGRSTNRPARRE
jgi:hypothetical protein